MVIQDGRETPFNEKGKEMIKQDMFIFDIDGTLADNSHRLHHIKGDKKDWKSYHSPELIMSDAYICETWIILSALINSRKVAFVTGRGEEQREVTTEWLSVGLSLYMSLPCFDYATRIKKYSSQALFMRSKEDTKSKIPSYESKRKNLNLLRQNYNVVGAFDDRRQDVKMYREEGITVYDVNNGDY